MEQSIVRLNPDGIAIREFDLPDRADAQQKIRAVHEFQQLVRATLIKDHDYGVIPGTGNKPTLLKPGAEKIAKLLGLADVYAFLEKVEDWDRPLFSYTIKCSLLWHGEIVAEGIGNCNSYESKYRWRWVYESDLKALGIPVENALRKEFPGRNGGRFSKFRVENDDIFSQVNTVIKMAKKRALVDAALSAGRLSDLFTQDIEDMADDTPPERIPGQPGMGQAVSDDGAEAAAPAPRAKHGAVSPKPTARSAPKPAAAQNPADDGFFQNVGALLTAAKGQFGFTSDQVIAFINDQKGTKISLNKDIPVTPEVWAIIEYHGNLGSSVQNTAEQEPLFNAPSRDH